MLTTLSLLALCLPAGAVEPGDITGTWWNFDKTRKVEIVENDGVLSGAVVWEVATENGESLIGRDVQDFL